MVKLARLGPDCDKVAYLAANRWSMKGSGIPSQLSDHKRHTLRRGENAAGAAIVPWRAASQTAVPMNMTAL